MNLLKTITLAAVVGLSAIASAQYDFVVLSGTDSQAMGAGGSQQVGMDISSNHAFLWNGGVSAGVDLNPPLWDISIAAATDGTYQVGTVTNSTSVSHAARWSGNSTSFVDLQTPLALLSYDDTSQAFGVSGNFVAGTGMLGGASRAILWTTPLTVVDLTPPGADGAVAFGVGGGYQAGLAIFAGSQHAVRWAGSATSYDDLHMTVSPLPLASVANATSGAQTVGEVTDFSFATTAALWNGTTYVNLHPASGYTTSTARAVANGRQVGTAVTTGGYRHAVLWNGTNAVTDLHSFATGYDESEATGIDAGGNITGYASNSFGTRAVYWRLTPYFGPFGNPINDPASPMSIFKRNSTLHLKIKLFDASGANLPNQVVRLEVTEIGTLTPGVDENSLAQGSTEGDVFSYDSTSQTYNYLMKTKTLSAGVTYELKAKLDGSNATHTVNIGLR